MLDYLWDHATQARFTTTHVWREGDMMLWDNRCVMHRRDAFDPTQRRVMHRTQMERQKPVCA